MKRTYTTREYVLGGLFSLMAAFPLVTATGIDVPLEGRLVGGELADTIGDKENQSALRRMRWSILRDCAQREALGEENACPDVNDYDAMVRYWHPEGNEAPVAEESVDMSIEDLGDYEAHILRRAQRVGQCPAELDALVPGFQELCKKKVYHDDRIDVLKAAAGELANPSQHYRLKGE